MRPLSIPILTLSLALPVAADPDPQVRFQAGRTDHELVLSGTYAQAGFVVVGTPWPGALAETGTTLALWNSAPFVGRPRPFVLDGHGRATFELTDAERASGSVVQAVVVDPSGDQDVLRARYLPAGLVLPPQAATATSNVTFGAASSAAGAAGTLPCAPGAVDLPDGLFHDTNCDGIDGTVARAVFVDWATGSLAASGTQDDPFAGVQAAIDHAFATPGLDHVYVSAGTYLGEVVLQDGVSIWGGYDASDGWSRATDHVTTLFNQTAGAEGLIGVRAELLAQPTTLGDVTVTTDTAPAGMHNYGVKAYQASDLALERVVVLAGVGGTGVDGPNGVLLLSSSSGGSGGSGGSAGWGDGSDGKNGFTGCGGLGGGGGDGGTSGSESGDDGANGKSGGTGGTGAPASNTYSIGSSVLVCNNTGSNGQNGCGGSGGGGGGGGGCLTQSGGNGGKGGRGGRAGDNGYGGFGGGTSMALFAAASQVTVVGGSLQAGPGGQGGDGGLGRTGENGIGGSGGTNKSCGGDGGDGGKGGNGGNGGRGGGAGGGHSFAVLSGPGASVDVQGAALQADAAGAGGAPNGLPGQALALKQL